MGRTGGRAVFLSSALVSIALSPAREPPCLHPVQKLIVAPAGKAGSIYWSSLWTDARVTRETGE